jgi:hypothetical protein
MFCESNRTVVCALRLNESQLTVTDETWMNIFLYREVSRDLPTVHRTTEDESAGISSHEAAYVDLPVPNWKAPYESRSNQRTLNLSSTRRERLNAFDSS